MQELLNSKSNDEIDMRELFIALWAYKLFIASTCALGIMFGGYYALNADKEFTSTAIFKLYSTGSNGMPLNGDLGILASLAGYMGGGSITTLPTDRVNGRIFIEKLDTKLNFQADPYFNVYNPNSDGPNWKSVIKSAIGWRKSYSNTQEATWQGIVARYSKNVTLDMSNDGAIKILVTHMNPQRAADIANGIMDEIISITKRKSNTEIDQQLSYLSNT